MIDHTLSKNKDDLRVGEEEGGGGGGREGREGGERRREGRERVGTTIEC